MLDEEVPALDVAPVEIGREGGAEIGVGAKVVVVEVAAEVSLPWLMSWKIGNGRPFTRVRGVVVPGYMMNW